jgi:hypothetical protein
MTILALLFFPTSFSLAAFIPSLFFLLVGLFYFARTATDFGRLLAAWLPTPASSALFFSPLIMKCGTKAKPPSASFSLFLIPGTYQLHGYLSILPETSRFYHYPV